MRPRVPPQVFSQIEFSPELQVGSCSGRIGKYGQMKGLWLENNALSFREDLPIPKPAEGEVLVKVLRAGICKTDFELTKGYYPYTGILGHEFVGRVVDENAPNSLQNQVVVGEISATCSNCEFCERNIPSHCLNRTVLGITKRNGCFAEFLAHPVKHLKIIPPEISVKEAAFVEPLAAAFEIQEQVKFQSHQNVLVVGDGKLGLLISLSLKLVAAQLSVFGRHKEKLRILENNGIQTFTDTTDVKERSFDVAVECTGNAEGFEFARKSLKPRGTLVMKSTYANNLSLNAAPIVVDELTLIGSRCGPFSVAIQALKSKKFDVLPLLSAEFPIDRGLEAFEYARKRGVLKVQLVFEE